MDWIRHIATVLTVIGGLNWGLVGIFDWNLVDEIFGAGSTGSRVVYTIVGIAAIVALWNLFVPGRQSARHSTTPHP